MTTTDAKARRKAALDTPTDLKPNAVRDISGALNIPLGRLPEEFNRIHRNQDVIVHCAGGYRSVAAMSILEGKGFSRIADLEGGFGAWQQANLPFES